MGFVFRSAGWSFILCSVADKARNGLLLVAVVASCRWVSLVRVDGQIRPPYLKR
jgi:hypothetical protein